MYIFKNTDTLFKEVVVQVHLPRYLLPFINQTDLLMAYRNVRWRQVKHYMRDRFLWELGRANVMLTTEIRTVLDADKTYRVLEYAACKSHKFVIRNKNSGVTRTKVACSLAKATSNVVFGLCKGRPSSVAQFAAYRNALELVSTDHPDHNAHNVELDLPQTFLQAELEIRVTRDYH